MVSRRFSEFVPNWARSAASNSLDDTPLTGVQPAFSPRLPIRLLPHHDGHSITALTLSQVVSTTQRILNYASYEVVHGPVPEFADLRSAESEVLSLAQLEVEPFEEGSFVIPARLTEQEIQVDQRRTFSGVDVLTRFVEAMEAIHSGQPASVSIGLIQAVEDLGRITRKEAAVEYSAIGIRGAERAPKALVVDNHYIAQASRAKLARRSTHSKPDELEGVVVAVDLVTYKFTLEIAPKTLVRGSYESLVADKMAACLGEKVKVHGVVEYLGGAPTHIRAFALDSLD